MTTQSRLHYWAPDLFGLKGGIQVYSDQLLKALKASYPSLRYEVFSKNDKKPPRTMLHRQDGANTRFHCAGYWPAFSRTTAFASQLMLLGLLQKPDLVIATHLNFTIAAYWLKRLAGIPYWAIAHGVEAWGFERSSLQRALRSADRIFAVSNYTRNRLLNEQGLEPSKVLLLPDTVNADDFEIALKPGHLLRRYGLSSAQPIILTVSRLVASEQYKGYDKILEALPYIRQAIPDVHYIISGQGNDRARIERLVSRLGLQDSVTLTGYISDNELCDHYNLCDVFAMPSKREGFGIVYLEALSCGKPVLAGNKDGAVDALCDGGLGALVDPDDTNEIADTLVQILKGDYCHPIIYNPEALRKKVIETYGFERFSKTVSGYMNEFFQSRSASNSTSRQP